MERKRKKLMNKYSKNFETIAKANIDEKKFEKIENIGHMKEIENFLIEGLCGTKEIANFIKNLLHDIIDSNYRKRQKISIAINFLKESNKKERTILIWIYILKIFPHNIIAVKNKINFIRENTPSLK